jgi:hypothetical protein
LRRLKKWKKIMNEKNKLRVLIPHWIEHNEEHASEFHRWAEQAGMAQADILLAAEMMRHVNKPLTTALEKLGGPLPADHLHHHAHGE